MENVSVKVLIRMVTFQLTVMHQLMAMLKNLPVMNALLKMAANPNLSIAS